MGREQPWFEQIITYGTDVVANIADIVAIDIGCFRSGSIGGALAATLTFYGCATEDGTFLLIEDSGSTDLSLTKTASRWSQLPAALFHGPRFIKIINDAAQEDFDIALKA